MKIEKSFAASCKNILTIFIVAISVSSCIDDEFDLKKVNTDMVYDPKLAITIGTVDIDLFKMLSDYGTEYLKADADGTLRLLFETDILSYRGYEKIPIPGQVPVIVPALIFPPAFTSSQEHRDSIIDIPIAFLADQRIDSMIAKDLSVQVTGTSSYTYDGEFTVTFESMKKGNLPFSIKIPVPKASAGSTVNVNYVSEGQLADGYKMIFNTATPGNSKLPIRVGLTLTGTPGQLIDPTQIINFNINIGDLSYRILYGYVGTYDIMNVEDSLDMSFLARDIANNIEWKEPSTKFFFENSYSMPIEVHIENMTAYSGISNEQINVTPGGDANPKNITFPAGSNLEAGDSIVFTKTNSAALYNALEKSPRSIGFKVRATCNHDGPSANNNILMDTSIIKGKMVFELPIYFRSSGFSQTDVMDFDLNLSSGDLDLESMLFRIISENDLPVDMLLQVEFLDEDSVKLGELFNPGTQDISKRVLKAAEVDNNGTIVKPTQYQYNIVFNDSQLKLLQKTKKLRYTTSMTTTNYDKQNLTGPYVRFKNNYHLKMTFVCQFQPRIKF